MFIGKYIYDKINKKYMRTKKQEWSVPSIMTLIIIVMMFFVAIFESIGLMNRQGKHLIDTMRYAESKKNFY